MKKKNTKRMMKTEVNDAIDALDERDKKDINKSLKIRIISAILYILIIIFKIIAIIKSVDLFVAIFRVSQVRMGLHLYYIFKTILMFIPAVVGFITILYEDNRVRQMLTRILLAGAFLEIVVNALDIFNVIEPMSYNINPLLNIFIDLVIIFTAIYSLTIYQYDTYYPEYINDIKDDIEDLEIDYSIKDKSPKNRG